MMFIVDKKIPDEAKKCLHDFGDLIELETSGITYDAISGHPDIFFCPVPGGVVVAPGIPEQILDQLKSFGVNIIPGSERPGSAYPKSAIFNALVTDQYLIHNQSVTDSSIVEACSELHPIHVKQAYTRCSLIAINKLFVTSDAGIHKKLVEEGLNVELIGAETVKLKGFPHGFIGGACGVWKDRFFVCGNLNFLPEGEKLRGLVVKAGYRITELYNGPLIDGGGIIALNSDG